MKLMILAFAGLDPGRRPHALNRLAARRAMVENARRLRAAG